jgi:hypothetical protein
MVGVVAAIIIILHGSRRSSREGTHHLDASLNDMIAIGIMNEQKYLIMKFRNKLAHFLLVNALDGLLNNATSVGELNNSVSASIRWAFKEGHRVKASEL